MEFHTDGPWILNIPTNCHKILNNSGKETFKVLKNYHQRRMTWNLKNIMFTKRHLMLFILQSWRCPWHQLLHNPGARCPEGDCWGQPSVEPSPTGWENVSGCKVLDTCCTALCISHLFSAVVVLNYSATWAPLAVPDMGGLSGKCLPETFNIEEPRNTL